MGTLARGYGEENIYRGTITQGEDLFVSFFSCPHPVLCPAAPNIFRSTKQYNCTASTSAPASPEDAEAYGNSSLANILQIFTQYKDLVAYVELKTGCWTRLNTAYCNFIAYKVFCMMMSGGGDEALESCFIAHFTAIQHFQVLFEDIKRNHTLTFRDTLTSSLASMN